MNQLKGFALSIDKERCKGCDYCVHVCPEKILRLSESTNLKGYHFCTITDVQKCTGCRFCAIICPEIAIEIEGPGPKFGGRK